jgi:hypothetical protein
MLLAEPFASLDSAAFPRLAAYLAQLPEGLRSYPECQARGSIFRQLLESRPLRAVREGAIPEALRQLGNSPPLDGDWLPEVWLGSVCLAIADLHGMDDAAFLSWVGPTNKRLFKGFHGFVISLISPDIAIRQGGGYWKMFHRGTSVTTHNLDRHLWAVRMTFPPRLFSGLLVAQYAPVFRAGLQLKTPSMRVELKEEGDEFALFHASWDP